VLSSRLAASLTLLLSSMAASTTSRFRSFCAVRQAPVVCCRGLPASPRRPCLGCR
jgi:hypothetical protein